MPCSICNKKSIYKNYCKEHFIDYFENKVKITIKKFKLLSKKDKIIVAASGGKDSLTILSILHKLGYNVSALAIDEGIKGYRDATLEKLDNFCKKNNIKLIIKSFKDEFSKSLDDILIKNNNRPCTVCGIFRRYLLNKYSRGYDIIATGHNLDDEAQAILMNLFKNNISALKRQGPVSGLVKSKKFTKRVKPLYYLLEKEVMIYAFLNNLTTEFNECPNVSQAFRLRIRDYLNNLELGNPETKKNLIDWFINQKITFSENKHEIKSCKICGENSSTNICKACEYRKLI